MSAGTLAAGGANLRVDRAEQESLHTALGLREGRTLGTAAGTELRAVVEGTWVHEYLDDASIDAGFAAAPATSFRITGPALGHDRALVGATVSPEPITRTLRC